MGPSPIGGSVNFFEREDVQMKMSPEKRSTTILRSVLLISQRLLASAEAVDESSVQLRYGQDWKAWVQLEKAGLSLAGVEQMVSDLREAVRCYQDEVADAAMAARSVRDAEEWNHG